MHELYIDCLAASELLRNEEVPGWIADVIVMDFVNGDYPHEHDYARRPAA